MRQATTPLDPHRAARRQLLVVLLVLLLFVAISTYIFLAFYGAYIDRVLYAERLSQMREVTVQLFTSLEEIVDNQWIIAENQSNYLLEFRPATADELHTLMSQQARLNAFTDSQSELMAVDNTGRYYTQDGLRGTLTGLSYLVNEPERINYVYNSMTTGVTEMVFLLKLPEAIPMQLGEQTVTLTYYGVSRSMTELEPYFSCAAYNGTNNVYVLDSNGSKLFSDSDNTLLQGHNLYTVLEQMEYLHDSSFASAKQELDTHKIAYSNAVLNGSEYYYALYRMEHAQWTLLFLVPATSVATNTVSMINTTVRMVLAFAIFLVVICAFVIYLLLRAKQKQILESERRNSAELMKVNAQLSRAVETAEAAMAKAEAASKAKSDFLANMSHDIRTPMNAIVGITNLMEHEGNLSDRLSGYIQKIKFSSRHLLSLINDILDMSKIESSGVALSAEPVSLAEQVGQVDSIIRSQTNEHEQLFQIHVHEITHEYLLGDGTRLRQIFLNLLSNAVKYTPAGGTITFDIAELPSQRPGYAKYAFTVTDNGCGMEPEFLAHIFEPFTRAERSITNKVQGTGLGMAITKNIVDLMGGTIAVTSTPGKGSRFTVTLPLQINTAAVYDFDARCVLLVSDDDVLIRNMRAPIQQTELDFHVVSSQQEAETFLSSHTVDVILLAGHLRDRTLADTVRLLRSAAANALLIFCVDFAQRDQVQQTLAHCGVDGLIPRPFFLSNLEVAIGRVRTNAAPEVEGLSVLDGMRFLCAEDNNLNAEILSAILEMYGASCTICRDGAEIVRVFETVKPGDYDAILMDIQMPKMNGYEATKAIRSSKNPLGQTIPIVAMTANAFSDDVQNSLAAGMDAHISKPIDVSVLEKTMRSFVTPPRVHRWQTDVSVPQTLPD